VKIEPHLGNLKNVQGEIPHPSGTIAAAYKLEGRKLNATITLPKNIAGTFVWKGKRYLLKAGQANKFSL
jgi:hypothetical protein